MDINLMLPMSIFLSSISFALLAKWYVIPQLANLNDKDSLTPLLLLHSFRHIGMAFLIPGVTAELLDARFALPAAYGDLLAALLAFLAIAGLRLGWKMAVALVWLFNVVGTVDLLNALFQGFRFNADGQMGATYFIPAVVVPALLVSHIMVFSLLFRQRPVVVTNSSRVHGRFQTSV